MFGSNSNFDPEKDIPDLTGRVILVTGGNSGLGKETILQLSRHRPAKIFLAARSEEKAKAAIKEIQEAVTDTAPISFLDLDLSSFASIKRAVHEFNAQSTRLDILVNNAGIMACPPGLTKEGYEIQFGTNHMGHALLTKLLLPTLQATAKTNSDVRIVSLSSIAEVWAPADLWDFGQLKTDMASTSTFTRYGISKLANVYHSRSLAERYPEIRCVSVHPGAVNTGLSRGLFASFPIFAPLLRLATPWVAKTPASGAKNQLWACVSPDAKSGEFYHPVGVSGKGSVKSQSRDLAEDLWKWTEDELKPYL